jgi:hypothetical protein
VAFNPWLVIRLSEAFIKPAAPNRVLNQFPASDDDNGSPPNLPDIVTMGKLGLSL